MKKNKQPVKEDEIEKLAKQSLNEAKLWKEVGGIFFSYYNDYPFQAITELMKKFTIMNKQTKEDETN